MKKTLAIFLTMAVLLCAVPHVAFAATTTEVDGMTYELNDSDKTATLTNGKSASGSVEIPGSVSDGYTVTAIGKEAFYYCLDLTSITIPNSVTSIGGGAFRYCGGLTSVTIGSGVKSIGNSAFSSCYELTSITIPDSVTTIGDYAFVYCCKLASVTISDKVSTLNGTFGYCTNLTSVTLGSGLSSIDGSAFGDCNNLTLITIPCNFKQKQELFKNSGITVSVSDDNTFTNFDGKSGTFVLSHKPTKTEKLEPTCVAEGINEHWTCSVCNGIFSDSAGKTSTTLEALTTDVLGHLLSPVAEVKATCVTPGTGEHYKCSRCGALFSDEAGTKSVTADELKLKAQGHNWETGEVTTAATPEKPGVKTYKCSRCGETKTEPVEYVSVPGGGDGDSTDSQLGAGGGDSNSTNLYPGAGSGDNNPTNSYSDAEPAVMAKRATIKTGDQLGLMMMPCMALLLLSAYGVLAGVKLRRKKHRK